MYTVIILDGHLASFSLPSLIQEDAGIPASRNLPPFPIWTSMVSSTINACRIIWDLIDNAKITVLVSGNSPEVIVKWNKHRDDRLSQMQKAFQEYRPKKINNGKRMQKIFEKSLDLILGNTDQDVITSRILYIATGEEDTGFNFRNNHQTNVTDIRANLYLACQKHGYGDRLMNIQIDAIRILPRNIIYPIPPISEQIMPGVNVTVYNIPNGEDDLRYTMNHLMQLYFNVDCINIHHYNTVNSSTEQESDMETINYYFESNDQHFIKQKSIKSNVYNIAIYDPTYLSSRTITSSIVQNQHQIKESSDNNEWCTCIHSVTTLNQIDEQAKRLLNVILNGVPIFLSTVEKNKQSKVWNQVLVCIKDKVYLKCVRHELDTELNMQLPHPKVKQELAFPSLLNNNDKVHEFMNTIVQPNLHQDIFSLFKDMSTTSPTTHLIDYNAYQYSSLQNDYIKIKTTKNMEKRTKWRTCLRDGYHYSTFNNNDHTLDIHLLNAMKPNSYLSSGYEIVSFGLINDLFDQLESAFVQDTIANPTSVESLVDMMINELLSVIKNPKKKTLFSKMVDQQQTQSLALKCLASLYFIAIRFNDDSKSHYMICQHVLNSIFEKKLDKEQPSPAPSQQQEEEMDTKLTPTMMMKKKSGGGGNSSINMAWEQATRYQNMTHREKSDAVNDIGTINPHFRGRRQPQQQQTTTNHPHSHHYKKMKMQHQQEKRHYPDPSIAIPYLPIIQPTWEEMQFDKTTKNPISHYDSETLLGQFWMTASKEISLAQEFDGRKPLLNDNEQGEIK